MKKVLLISLLMVMLSPFAFAQTEKAKQKPNWAENPVHFEGKTSTLITISEYGRTKESTIARAFKTLEDEGRKINEGYRIIEEYWDFEPEWAYGYFLVQVSKEKTCSNWERVEVNTTKYPFSGRVFVPGMAQIYKGSKVKGGLIIGGEVLGVAGIVTSFSMKASNERLMQEDRKHASTYAEQADMWQNIGFGAIAFTAAVYIYNIIDGAVARGKNHIQIGSKAYEIAFMPMATPRGDVGLAARITF